jgi:hypothetical protein
MNILTPIIPTFEILEYNMVARILFLFVSVVHAFMVESD